MRTHRPALKVVRSAVGPPSELLASIVPELIEAEATARRLRTLMLGEARLLARERGVAFLREESVRREFGNG